MTVEMELVGVRVQMPTNTPILLLRETGGRRRVVPIYIGGPEAHAIDLAIQKIRSPRPMTHDLMAEVIDNLGASLEKVVVSELRSGTFYAELHLRNTTGGIQTISARTSDAVALAVRTGTQIFAAEDLVDEAGIEEADTDDEEGNEEQMVQELRDFLDQVNPEDFLP